MDQDSDINRFRQRVRDELLSLAEEGLLDTYVRDIVLRQHLVFGNPARLTVADTAIVNNALFNVSSGSISVGDYAFFGHSVAILTGTHDESKFGPERQLAIPNQGNDIVIERGVWIASNATVLGPCHIGEDAVVAAGAVVTQDVPRRTVVAGVPARVVKTIA